MTRAAIYLRISLDPAGDHLAVDRQLEDCRRLAEERDWSVVKEYTDNSISASKSGVSRPAYDRMVTDFDAGGFDALVCWDLDRLTRQPRQLEDWIDRAESRGLKLVTANGEADLTTDGGRMYARIKAAVARAEAERKGARQRAANKQRIIAHGGVYGRKTAWGWLDRKCLEVDENAASMLRSAVDDVLAGKSTNDIAREWNDSGVMAPGGKRWTSTTVRTTLLRPINAGIVTYHDVEHREVESQWTPILTTDKYDAMKTELKLRGNFTGQGVKSRKYLVGGIATCGKCGSRMQGTTQKSGVNYLCSGREYGCYRAVRVSVMDNAVREFTARALLKVRPTDYMSQTHVDRLREIGDQLESLRVERATCASSDVTPASKVAWFAKIDDREAELRSESVDLTKDSAMASLLRDLVPDRVPAVDVLGTPSRGLRASLDRAVKRRIQVEERLRKLSIRQQRMLVKEFGTYVVLDRKAKPRVQITELRGLPEDDWDNRDVVA